MKIPVGARAVGMGSAFTALVDDASALYWNPSGIARIDRTDLLASHNEWIADTRASYVGLAQRLGFGQVIGISYLTLYMDPLDRRNEQGIKTGTFQARDRAVAVSWATSMTSRLSLGVTAKQIVQTIDDAQARGSAIDAGVQIRPHRRVSLGASITNVGGPMKFVEKAYALPTTLRAGLGYNLTQGLVLALEGTREAGAVNSKTNFAAGVEYNMLSMSQSYFWSPVAWRLGYFSPNGPGVGLGLKIFGSNLDYALTPMGELGLTHRVSLNLKFGKNRTRETWAPKQVSNSMGTKSGASATTSSGSPSENKKKEGKTGTIFDFLFR
ncbi:MAG: PorV/PorQ family protein [Elusimicrobia bacterium]|nr:PorV/PorQ family protein [Elusimicrobiota bacterium]